MDQEVAKTLGLLELKLQELERELTTIGRHDSMPITETVRGPVEGDEPVVQEPQEPLAHEPLAQEPVLVREPASATERASSFALVDEVAEQRQPSPATTEEDQNSYQKAIDESDLLGAPAMFGGEEVPSQSSPAPTHDWGLPRETAYGEIPTAPGDPSALRPEDMPATAFTASSPPPPPPLGAPAAPPTSPPRYERPIERAELIAFRNRLTRTLDELVEEYDRLLAGDRHDHPGL